MFVFVVFVFIIFFRYYAKTLAVTNVSEMTYFMSGGM